MWILLIPMVIALMPAVAGAQSVTPLLPTVTPAPAPLLPGQNPAAIGTRPPKVRLCTPADLLGFWELRKVFETPAGVMDEDFKKFPHQYFYFNKDGVRYDFKSTQEFEDQNGLLNTMKKKNKDLQQYVIGDTGVLYFYTNREPTGSFYCGFSEEKAGPYFAGDMILTPTTAANQSLFMIWQRLSANKEPQVEQPVKPIFDPQSRIRSAVEKQGTKQGKTPKKNRKKRNQTTTELPDYNGWPTNPQQ